jgi:hypothetical protein
MGWRLQLFTAERAGFPWNRIRAGYRCGLYTVLEPVSPTHMTLTSECLELTSYSHFLDETRVYQRESAKNGGKAPPEARLLMGMAGALVTPIGMFIFTFTTYKSVPWIIPILGTVFFGMGIVWVFTSVFTYLVE